MKLPSLRDVSLREQSFEVLKAGIFSGKLTPGEMLRELTLARSLKVSQATIREALFQLEQIGLVVRVPNKGTRVKVLSREEFAHRFAIRIQLEEMAMVEAAGHMTAEDFDTLERLAEMIARRVRSGELVKSTQLDLEFHQHVWRKSGNPVLSRMLDQVTTPIFAFALQAVRRMEARVDGQPHKALVEALRSGDKETMRQAIRWHTRTHYERYLGAELPDSQA